MRDKIEMSSSEDNSLDEPRGIHEEMSCTNTRHILIEYAHTCRSQNKIIVPVNSIKIDRPFKRQYLNSFL